MQEKILYVLGFVMLFAMLSLGAIQIQASDDVGKSDDFSSYVDAKGNISLPSNIRLNLQHLGSWFVKDGGASGFHDVFTEASTIQYYQQHKSFPDGATLVKELRANETGDYTTGVGVKYSTSIKQWFVMIKDKQNRFPNNANWGDGWGWALIKPSAELRNISTNYKSDCLACHVPAKNNDWVYTEAYPVLHEQSVHEF